MARIPSAFLQLNLPLLSQQLWNEPVHAPVHRTLQDSNDRFLANTQRGGSYSVIPRVPGTPLFTRILSGCRPTAHCGWLPTGGEILPDQLIALGTVAKKYGLYSKITGGQRVDLFGAPVHQAKVGRTGAKLINFALDTAWNVCAPSPLSSQSREMLSFEKFGILEVRS